MAGADMGTGSPSMTDSLSLPQFGAPDSQLRLLLMGQARLCGFPLTGWELTGSCTGIQISRSPGKSETLFALLRAGPEPTKVSRSPNTGSVLEPVWVSSSWLKAYLLSYQCILFSQITETKVNAKVSFSGRTFFLFLIKMFSLQKSS